MTDQERLYFNLRNLVETIPDLNGQGTPDLLIWLGRAEAIIPNFVDQSDAGKFKNAVEVVVGNDTYISTSTAIARIQMILYRALGVAELGAPINVQGTYIPAGNTFDAVIAVGRVFSTAKSALLIVDPYADEKLLRDFAPMASEHVSLRILSDEHTVKPSFAPAVSRWQRQNQQTRLLEARLSPARQLHDRLIIVDDSDVWIVTQSFNALAERAPASLSKFTSDSAQLKLDSYRLMWDAATPT